MAQEVMIKKKIIQLMTHLPAYEVYANQPKPKIHWDTPIGSWVGIWGYDWAELMGKAMVNEYPDYDYEVWQMDTRADKIYEAILQERLMHRKFPGIIKHHRPGIKKENYVNSPALIEYVKRNIDAENYVFLMPATVETPFTRGLLKVLKNVLVIHYNFLNTSRLAPGKEFTLNPLRNLHRYLRNRSKKRHLNSIHFLLNSIDNNPDAIEEIKRKYISIRLFDFHLGTDLAYWNPDKKKQQSRDELDIGSEDYVIFLSQRLVPEYQIDKFIGVISKIQTNKKFLCIISGHGERVYESYLNKLCKKLAVDHLIRFVGFVTEEQLKKYYTACDVFATVPNMVGASNSAVKAMAMERPVIHTTQGVTYQFLRSNNAGVFIEASDYNQWVIVFTEAIEGKQIKIVPREKVINHFSWEKTANQLFYAISHAK